MDRRRDEEENMVALYKASFTGCVNTLNILIQKDALILHKVSLTSFTETPLHIVALLGHFEFTRALVNKKPKLAEEVDSLGRTPIHLASAEGHTEIVKVLLQVNIAVCLVSDQHGRIPLHLAAIRGRVDILKELFTMRQDSIKVNLNGDSVLHLCVRHNHLDALKSLVEFVSRDELFLDSKDQDGNNILHLAVMLKQIKTIKYLLSISEIKRKGNAVNRIGNTAFDVLEMHARDFRFYEIRDMLKEAGVRRSTDLNSSPLRTLIVIGVDEAQEVVSELSTRSRCGTWWQCFLKTFKHHHNWMEEMRGALMLVATVTATMSFQAGINPPGGIWQDCEEQPCDPGKAVLSYSQEPIYLFSSGLSYPQDVIYVYFLTWNTISFFASVSVVLLVISGFPLKSKIVMWFLTVAMFIAILSISNTYLYALLLLTPNQAMERFRSVNPLSRTVSGLLYVVMAILAIRLISWVIKKLRVFKRNSASAPSQVPQPLNS